MALTRLEDDPREVGHLIKVFFPKTPPRHWASTGVTLRWLRGYPERVCLVPIGERRGPRGVLEAPPHCRRFMRHIDAAMDTCAPFEVLGGGGRYQASMIGRRGIEGPSAPPRESPPCSLQS